MIKTQTIPWQPFSEKHKRYIKKAMKSRMCVAEGAIRSGKTIDHCIIAAAYLETCADKIHLASGSTIGNAKLNIGDCNGFGLEHLFRGRCRWGKYKDNDALYILTKTGEKVVIFAGGGKADSYKRILGNSYGLWMATEVNEHYDSDDSRTSFLKVAMGRQLAAVKPFVLWDLNPCNPGHDIYEHYIDKYLDSYPGYLYEHFTIDDNLSITPERRAEIEQQYVVGSVWYRRDILGERCIAEGLVYPMYEKALTDDLPGEYEEQVVSIDYGTQNAFAALKWGLHDGVWYLYDCYYYSGRDTNRQKTDEQYADDLDDFTRDIDLPQGRKLEVIVDPSAASFIAVLRQRHRYKVRKADNAVADGLRETATCMDKGYIKINKSLTPVVKELSGYMWDAKKADETPVKDKDHCLTGDTLVETEHGQKKIADLVGTTGKVWSYNTETGQAELKDYHDVRVTSECEKILQIRLEDGREIKCTGDHPILTNRGYVLAKYLNESDEIVDIMDAMRYNITGGDSDGKIL